MVLYHLLDSCKMYIHFYLPLPQIILMKITSTAAAELFAIIKKTSQIKINQICCISTIQYKINKLEKKTPQTKPPRQNSFIQLHLEMSSSINPVVPAMLTLTLKQNRPLKAKVLELLLLVFQHAIEFCNDTLYITILWCVVRSI